MPARGSQGTRGKLKAVARRWASGRGGKPKAADDPLTAAAPLPDRAPASAERELEVSPDEQSAVLLFLSLETQWRQAGMTGVRTGLDYTAVEPVARFLAITPGPDLLRDLRIMEVEALNTWAEART